MVFSLGAILLVGNIYFAVIMLQPHELTESCIISKQGDGMLVFG
jgi:hypothetical protein